MKQKTKVWAGVAALLVTAAVVLIAHRSGIDNGKPSRRAPQVPISNPGEQSEFTTTASESEVG